MEPSYDACDQSDSNESEDNDDYEATYYKPTQPISQLVNQPHISKPAESDSEADEDYECTHDQKLSDLGDDDDLQSQEDQDYKERDGVDVPMHHTTTDH